MDVKPGYKQTEVGIIPEDWEPRRIDSVCKLINGRGFKPHEWQTTGLPIIRIQNLNGSDDFNYFRGTYDRKLEVEPGQLLFAWSGSRGTSFGPHIWQGSLGLLNYHTWKVVIREEDVNKGYFLHSLRQLTTFIEDKAHGASALVHTQKWEMEGFQFPLPPTLAEQEAIAGALSDADALIESLEQLVAKKRQIKLGAMQELLTGKRRLPGFATSSSTKQSEAGTIPEDWGIAFVKDFAHITTGSRNTQDRVEDGEYPFFVRSQIVERINSYSFDGEAVLTAGDGVGTGKVFHYINAKFDTHQRVYRISHFSEQVSGYFFYLYFSTYFYDRIMQMTAKSSVDSVRMEMIAKMPIPLPSTRKEQQAIATILSDMDAEITALEAKLAKARQVKQGMMQELLTGRIRLI